MNYENSSSLKAGNTRSKNTNKGAVGANLSKKGFGRLKGQQTGTITSQSEMDSNLVVIDGKVKTPKELVTKKYKEYTQEYLKILQTQQQAERKAKEQNQIKVKSSLNSQNDSQMKISSSMNQDKSFMSSSKSQVDSQAESKKEKDLLNKKDPKELTIQDLQKNVIICLQQTQTIFTFYLPSTCYKQEDQNIKIINIKYRQYMQKRIGSDNYIARPIQTFNFQHKKMAQLIQKPINIQCGSFASGWDIFDIMKLEKKTQYEILHQDIKKNVQKEFSNFLINPFSCLALDKDSISIHSKYQIPGAAQYILKEKQLQKKTKSKKLGIPVNTTLAEPSSKNNRQTQKDGSYKKQQSSQNNRKGFRSAQLQMQIRQQQQKIQEQEKYLLDQLLKKAKELPSQEQRRLMNNQNLEKMLKYIDRILNSQTYQKQYILYRNYPEIEFIKKTPEDELRNFATKKKEKKKEENKDPLQYLFSFKCKEYQNYSITSADWNPVNKDLLAVSYEILAKDEKINDKNPIKGLLMFWTLKNPAFPEKIFTSESSITACKFSVENPNLIACGTDDGIVAIYDIRKKDNMPIAQNKESLDKHTNSVWDIQWISKGKGNKGQSLVSISADGRITEWSMKKGLEYTDLMLLRRIPQSSKKDTAENMNFRFASGLSFEFLRGQSSMYLATTQEGIIYRCSKSYTQQYLQVYTGHDGPVYKVRGNPFFHDIFLTCSADWSCKLWNWRKDQYLNSFQSLDLIDEVIDIQWSPTEATIFASVCKDGRLQLWDLEKKNMLDPISIVKKKGDQKTAPKTMVRFCKGCPILITGDINGDIDVYRLNRDEQNFDYKYQHEKLVKLLYPNGYTFSSKNEVEQISESENNSQHQEQQK